MRQIITIDDELLNNATHCLAMDDINEVINIALRELIKNHPAINKNSNQLPDSMTVKGKTTDDLVVPCFDNEQKLFNPKQFFAVRFC
ncbi:MAG: type II toxin-antitoxin system VapB family antitoxin [Methylococcales bacterium]|nr:type II toxin-antitoxin system VapB family antitoxin [Methylococcales bacterium]